MVAVIIAAVAVLIVAGGVVGLIVRGTDPAPNTGPDTEPVAGGPAPAARTAPDRDGMTVGQTLTVQDEQGTQLITLRSVKSYQKGCKGSDATPTQGHYVVADIEVRIKSGTATVNPLWFGWIGSDGVSATAMSGQLTGCEQSRLTTASDLRAGTVKKGQVTFDVAETKGTLRYAQVVSGSTRGSWKVT